jgi:hypothetical protein
MNWEAISTVGDVIGAAAVIVTLIYLAFQMRQNTRAIQGSTLDSVTQVQQNELRWASDISDVFSKAIENPSGLDSSEAWKMSEWLISALSARQNEFFQFERGHIDAEEWDASERIILVILSLPWARNWWKTLGQKVYHAGFTQVVDELYEKDAVLIDFKSVLRDLKSVDA